MRNLKRVLALALALVMMLGMMITASAATYADQDAIDAKYADAVEILTGMGVFQGTGAGFAPKQILTRAEASALIYRVITGDVTDKQVDLYDYAAFADTAEGAWYTGYITYAANGGYIKGFNGNAMPNETVTGIQVMAIMLRAAGYGQNGEYEGAAWKDNILTDAKELGITGKIATNDLDKPATRELVAQLIFNAMTSVDMVSYNMLLGYTKVNVGTVWAPKTQTLAEKVFDLDSYSDHDDWGRPVEYWYADVDGDETKDIKETLYATIEATPVAAYTTEVSECDIAKDLGLRKDATVTVETLNGEPTVDAGDYIDIQFSPIKTVGAQGRLTEVYENDTGYEIVYIDQFLAVVEDVTDVEYDKNGHITEQATMLLTIYNDYAGAAILETANVDFEYAVGDMLLVYFDEIDEIVEVVDYANSMVGAQTAYTTDPVHIVEDVEYPDAIQFNHDEAVNKTVDYTWYFDTYGNLIGSFTIRAKNSYGTISSIYWRDSNNGENGYAVATITYMDGTSETATVYSIDENVLEGVEVKASVSYETGLVSSTKQYNVTEYTNVALYKISNGQYGLILETVAPLVDAYIETGVPALNDELNAGRTTQFLVWNGKTYETYTGIRNVPTYDGVVTGYYVDARNDGVADYIFVINPVDPTATTDVFYFWNTSLTVKTHLKNNAIDYYTVTGGYVNGAKEAILFDAGSEAVLREITNRALNSDVLLKLHMEDGYVVSYTVVTDKPTSVVINGVTYWAVYAGAVDNDTPWTDDDAALVDDVLMPVNGAAYDVEGLDNVITYNKDLARTIRYDDAAYLYVVYTQSRSSGLKVAQTVYITDVEGTDTTVAAGDEMIYFPAGDRPERLSLDIDPLTVNESVAVVIYDAAGNAIGSNVLNTVKYPAGTEFADGLSCAMYLDPTEYTSSSWNQDWTANENVVPVSYKVFIDGAAAFSGAIGNNVVNDGGDVVGFAPMTAADWAALFA